MTFIEKLVVSLIVLIVLVCGIVPVILLFTGLHYKTGQGEHTGYVTAIEKNGIIFKTGRAYFKTDTQSSQEDSYCVIDPNVYSQLEKEAQSKERVTVKYLSYFAAGIKNCAGEDAIIYGIN